MATERLFGAVTGRLRRQPGSTRRGPTRPRSPRRELAAFVVTAALTPQTRHLFDAAAFARCKPSALFVNVARGGLVDQAALRDALVEGRIAGAALDVTDPEPLPAGDPLWSAPNLVISPHFAGGGSTGSLRRLAEGAAENLRRSMAGEPLLHQVQ